MAEWSSVVVAKSLALVCTKDQKQVLFFYLEPKQIFFFFSKSRKWKRIKKEEEEEEKEPPPPQIKIKLKTKTKHLSGH